MSEPRIVCQFSCGAASAVATKLTLAQFGATRDVQIINAFVKEEHQDNRRFLADCEKWFEHPVTILRDEKFNASIIEVFMRERYMGGHKGAPCSRALKRRVMDDWRLPSDEMVLGFTSEEADRFEGLKYRLDGIPIRAPLIERNLTKADCLAIVERAGIELPIMYRLGYNNANCIGCIKGGEGYFNKVRRDFPEEFERLCQTQEAIGPGAYLFRNRKTGERYSLRDMPPNKGRHNETVPSCSFHCELAEAEL